MEIICSSSAIREALNIPSWNCRANWFRIIPPIESRELRNPGGPPTALVLTAARLRKPISMNWSRRALLHSQRQYSRDRKSCVQGKMVDVRVDNGGSRSTKKNKKI